MSDVAEPGPEESGPDEREPAGEDFHREQAERGAGLRQAFALNNLARVAHLRGDREAAERLHGEARQAWPRFAFAPPSELYADDAPAGS